MTRADKLALLISLIGVLAAYYVTVRVFEGMAHIEDEMAFVWQAQAIAGGSYILPSPPEPDSFWVPFVIDRDGMRFGKYPLGWPVLLSFGVRLGIRAWINPLLAGLAVWLTYRLGKRILSESVGLLAAVLTITSPFFLMNSGSLLSHPFGLVLSAAFALAWVHNFGDRRRTPIWLLTITAGLTLGLFALTRPYTALGVALPFGVHGAILVWRGDRRLRTHLLALGGVALLLSLLHFVWQFALTGEALTSPYTLWWEYDKVGFGEGFGRSGHNLQRAMLILLGTTFRAGGGCIWLGGALLRPAALWAVGNPPKWEGLDGRNCVFLAGDFLSGLLDRGYPLLLRRVLQPDDLERGGLRLARGLAAQAGGCLVGSSRLGQGQALGRHGIGGATAGEQRPVLYPQSAGRDDGTVQHPQGRAGAL